jgi:radical SAM-linked protein
VSHRLRIRFAKLGKVRFTSHRDVARMWERALRRTGLAVANSQGFNPRPLLSFGLALPTGAESLAEYLDVTLAPGPDGPTEIAAELGRLAVELSAALPDGLDVVALGTLEGDVGSLQQEVTSCSWDLEVRGVTASELARRVELVLGAPSVSVQRERKGRTFDDDLRPSVRSLVVSPPPAPGPAGEGTWLRTELATFPRGVRPKELVEALGADLVLSRARRTQQWIERDGIRREPLEVPLAEPLSAPHAKERAS